MIHSNFDYSKTMERLDTNQALPLQFIHEKRTFVTLLRSGGVPDAIYDSRKVAHVESYHGVFEIFYNEELLMPLIRTIDGAWYYAGNINTTIYQVLCYFGFENFIAKCAFDLESNKIIPSNDMLLDPVSSACLLTVVAY